MGSKGIYIRVDEKLLEKFTELAYTLGLSRSEAIRKAMEDFIEKYMDKSFTSRMRGLVKSRFTLKELEEIYLMDKGV